MTNTQILLFCGISLAIAFGLVALLFPQAVMTEEQRARLDTPQPAESLGEIDLGGYFGKVKVTELVDYYITNPPDADAATTSIQEDRFGGC